MADAKKFGERVNSIQFFLSEDGLDWHECQALFADDTVKIMYDQNGVIVSVVDKPVPSRGNTLAVSMFNPANRSVAEISVADYPENFTLDGSWIFDGATITQSAEIIQARMLEANTAAYKSRLRDAVAEFQSLQLVIDTGKASKDDKEACAAIRDDIIQLRKVDLTSSDTSWMEVPTCGAAKH
ncbi:tail fiber assembly protein [Buttiauxella sp. 3AFRM03]|uniref:tail fiber assembly protein n=1 Tax=Buttiauxella sp. 3AFRM03 TaxID=2479367 RepID=UPI001390495D|nr:tail fiber assembly protein [Buttiauxella sp. 3AFRM03]